MTAQPRLCAAYVACGVAQMARGAELDSLGGASDAGWAHGHKVLATQFMTPDNFAVHAIPQATWAINQQSAATCMGRQRQCCFVFAKECTLPVCLVMGPFERVVVSQNAFRYQH